jgi:hypothetical protein
VKQIHELMPELPGRQRIEDEIIKKQIKGNKYYKEDEIIYPGSDVPYIKSDTKIGRNDPFLSGSSKKYKNCYLKK